MNYIRRISKQARFLTLLCFGFVFRDAAFSQSPRPLLLSVDPLPLMAQRLHPASYPLEAEVRCGAISDPCVAGLTRGFVIGGDVGAMLRTPVLQPWVNPGRWYFYDAFVGFQMLRAVDEKIWANASIGLRGFGLRDSDEREVWTRGLTWQVSFAQLIQPFYSQGVQVQGFAGSSVLSPESGLLGTDWDARRTLQRFYRFSQTSPRIRVGFPAHLEVVNWKASHVDLPNHLRAYLVVEPFYVQNDLVFPDYFVWVEKNPGLRLGFTTSYEAPSAAGKHGKWALAGTVGLDLAGSTASLEKRSHFSQNGVVDLPRRSPVSPFLDLIGAYQF